MSASGLSDVLRDMAQGPAPAPPRSSSSPPARQTPAEAAEPLDDAGGLPPTASVRRTPAARPAEPDALRSAAAAAMAVVGLMLFVPGLWAVAVLAGLEVWRADWPGATRMAAVMLACLPLGGTLFGGAWWLHREQRAARAARHRRNR